MLACELEQRSPLGGRQRVAGRVLEVRDDVRELGLHAGAEQLPERLDVDPVGLERDHPHVSAATAQRQQRSVVGRPLDDHRVAGLNERLEQERVRLHRPVGHDHLLGRHLMALGDPRSQRRIADRRAVGGHPAGVLGKCGLRGGAQTLHVDDVERRGAACE